MGQYREYVDDIKSQLLPLRRELKELVGHHRGFSHLRGGIRIVVAGGFSCGKSAFINHILGSNVAVEGVTATTRCSTEYFYSDEQCWLAGDRRIAEDEYRTMSSCEGSNERFLVGVRNDFLKDGVTIVDTPGFGDRESDNDNAKREIRDSDVLFWLVNVNGGTILESELKALVSATSSEEGKRPLVVFLTQVDLLKADRNQNVGAKFNEIQKKIAEQLREKELRLVLPPQAVSSKPYKDSMPSLRRLLEGQDGNVFRIVEACKREFDSAIRRKSDVCEKKCKLLKDRIESKMRDAEGFLVEQRESTMSRLEENMNVQKSLFRSELVDVVEKHLETVGRCVCSSNAAIVSRRCACNWIWDDYTSHFNPSLEFLEAPALYAKIGALLKKHSTYDGDPFRCDKAVSALLTSLASSIHLVKCDGWGDNRFESRNRIVGQLRYWLCYMCHDAINESFLRSLELPKLEWRNSNADMLRTEIDEITLGLKRLKDMRRSFVQSAKPLKNPSAGTETPQGPAFLSKGLCNFFRK